MRLLRHGLHEAHPLVVEQRRHRGRRRAEQLIVERETGSLRFWRNLVSCRARPRSRKAVPLLVCEISTHGTFETLVVHAVSSSNPSASESSCTRLRRFRCSRNSSVSEWTQCSSSQAVSCCTSRLHGSALRAALRNVASWRELSYCSITRRTVSSSSRMSGSCMCLSFWFVTTTSGRARISCACCGVAVAHISRSCCLEPWFAF